MEPTAARRQDVRARAGAPSGSYLLRYSGDGDDLFLSSDILANSSKRPCRQFYELVPEDVRAHFHSVGVSIEGRLIFPAERVSGMQTVNQLRGTHPCLRDRFDLTLECIRRYCVGEDSPLSPALRANEGFFQLFREFDRYVAFFLLQDLVDDSSTEVRFYLPLDDFTNAALPTSPAQYGEFLQRQVDFVEARNRRITGALAVAAGWQSTPAFPRPSDRQARLTCWTHANR